VETDPVLVLVLCKDVKIKIGTENSSGKGDDCIIRDAGGHDGYILCFGGPD
jgi:hypothetical protein